MSATNNFILLCIFSINCLCNDIISISIDSDKLKERDKTDDKNIKIEIRKARNMLHENIIPINRSSGTLEHYVQKVSQGQELNPWILLRKGKRKKTQNVSEISGRILDSIEETGYLWTNRQKDRIYNAKMPSEPECDHIIHDKIDDFENLRPDNKRAEIVKAYPDKVPNTSQKEREIIQRGHKYIPISQATNMKPTRKKHNVIPIIHLNTRNAWPKIPSENESKEGKGIPDLEDKISTVKPKSNTKKHSLNRHIIRKNKRNAKTKMNKNYTENIPIEPVVKMSSFKSKSHTKEHNVIPIFRIINTINEWTNTNKNYTDNEPIDLDTHISKENMSITKSKMYTKRIHNEIPIFRINSRNAWTKKYRNYSEHSSKLYENSKNDMKRELLNVLHIAGSRTRRAQTKREKPACENYNTNNSSAARNSTIEVSDHEYQANRNAEEGDDQESFDDYPYSASVQRKGSHYTSGAIVGERWILSTAAEFYNVRETIKLFRARVGSVDCKKGGILTPIKSIVVHSKFTPGHPAFDVSVLETVSSLISSISAPIRLARVSERVENEKFLTTYWPRIVVKQSVMHPTAKERHKFNSMRVSTHKLVPADVCRQLLATVNVTLDKNSLCLRPVKIYHSDCMPDAGVPVVAMDGLLGITSGWVSPQCPDNKLPTVFTRVSKPALHIWIDEQMMRDENK